MTGGRLVVLGESGRNFGAGMSGGIAYVYDPEGNFPEKVNMGLVGLESLDDDIEKEEVYNHIKEHVQYTNSTVVKDMPHDYKRVLLEKATRGEPKVEAA